MFCFVFTYTCSGILKTYYVYKIINSHWEDLSVSNWTHLSSLIIYDGITELLRFGKFKAIFFIVEYLNRGKSRLRNFSSISNEVSNETCLGLTIRKWIDNNFYYCQVGYLNLRNHYVILVPCFLWLRIWIFS